MKVMSKVWFENKDELIFGTGKAAILKHIQETGSINKAAKKMHMSYRHAWSYICSVEKRLGRSLLIKRKGGIDGGGTELTDYAKDLIKRFEKLDNEVRIFTNKRYREIFCR